MTLIMNSGHTRKKHDGSLAWTHAICTFLAVSLQFFPQQGAKARHAFEDDWVRLEIEKEDHIFVEQEKICKENRRLSKHEYGS